MFDDRTFAYALPEREFPKALRQLEIESMRDGGNSYWGTGSRRRGSMITALTLLDDCSNGASTGHDYFVLR